jgi:hypothetical protein
MKYAKVCLAVLTGLLVLGGQAAATASSKSSQDDADQKELYQYVLTLGKVHKLQAAMGGLASYAQAHHQGSDWDDLSNAKSLGDMVQVLGRHPGWRALLAKNGLTPREYAVGGLTLMQAWMAVSFKKNGTYKQYPPDVLKTVSPANLAFVEKHFDEINKAFAGSQGGN